jgi:hypothetical protein
MINIRYHIVSITAVFLALGIGAALGSTFLDRYTVGLLDRNIRSAERRIRSTNEENDRLNRDLDQADARDEALILVGGESLLSGHLDDVPVLVVTAPGVDPQAVNALRTSLDRSGADLRGTLALTDGLEFADGVDDDLASALGLDDPTPAKLRNAVFRSLESALVDAGQPAPAADEETTTTTTSTTAPAATTTTAPGTPSTTAPATTTTTTTAPKPEDTPGPDGEQPAIVDALVDRSLVRFEPGRNQEPGAPILEVPGYRYVFVTTPSVTPTQTSLLMRLLPARADAEAPPAVVVSPSESDDSTVVTAVDRVRGSSDLSARYGTVDDLDTFTGLVATVLSLESIDTRDPGHYGQGEGATAILPPAP